MSDRIGAVSFVVLIALEAAGNALAQTAPSSHIADSAQPPSDTLGETAKGHGAISISYLNTYVNGFYVDSNTKIPTGAVRSQGVALDLDYNFAEDWSAHLGIPFLSNRYDGPAPHCPTNTPPQCAGAPVLNPQHPESQFLDDGNTHGTWQDWTLGAAYHTHIGDYLITPSITATIPSHGYVFFANAAVAQDIWQLEFAATLAHQFAFTNLYYSLGYGYVFTERNLGTSVSHNRWDLELGYFVSEKLSLRTFTTGRVGHGYTAAHLLPITDGQTNAYWYHHDQISEHNYAGVGLGLDYQFADNYTLSTSIQRLIWGETVFDFKYAFEARLIKQF